MLVFGSTQGVGGVSRKSRVIVAAGEGCTFNHRLALYSVTFTPPALRLSFRCTQRLTAPPVQTLDPSASASPGWGDGRCSREGECVSLRVDLEVASRDLRVGVRVKASTLEKALLPTGKVRLLEFRFRGSVSIRAELRDEFPFVSTVRKHNANGGAPVRLVARLPQQAPPSLLTNVSNPQMPHFAQTSSAARAMAVGDATEPTLG